MRISKSPEERKAELITAARYLFDKDGVDKTRVSDIVQRVGVAQGVFYYYFSSKEKIVETVVDEVVAELDKDIQTILKNESADIIKRLSGLLELYFDFIDQFTSDDMHVLPNFESGIIIGSTPMQRAREILMEYIQQIVSEGVATGQIKASYSKSMVQVLEVGLHWLASQEQLPRKVVYTLVEQALCIEKGKLVQYA
jgi:Transcriptional regulator